MDSSKLNEWMQVVGIFAVVASLVFVGLQMRQSEEIAIAAIYQERSATGIDFFKDLAQSEIQRRVYGERLVGRWGLPSGLDENTSTEEFGSQYLFARAGMLTFDNVHFQYEAGFLSEEAWIGRESNLRRALTSPVWQFMVERDGHTFRSSFRQLCETLIAENESAAK